MSVFEILKKYTYDEELITLLANFEKNNFEEFTYDRCVLSLKDNKVNLGGVLPSNSVKENGEIFKKFQAFIKLCRSRERSVSLVSEDLESDWKKIKKDTKDKLLHHFIMKAKNKYRLSFSEQSKLEHLLSVNIKLNYIPSSSFIIQGNEIVEIKNLVFDEEKREWEVLTNRTNFKLPESSTQQATVKEISSIYSKIDKYCEFRRFTN